MGRAVRPGKRRDIMSKPFTSAGVSNTAIALRFRDPRKNRYTPAGPARLQAEAAYKAANPEHDCVESRRRRGGKIAVRGYTIREA